jgi:hypothetical protein
MPRPAYASSSASSNVSKSTTGFAVGDVAPNFTAFDQNGNRVSLQDFYGRFVILDLSAAWCSPSAILAGSLMPQVVQDLGARSIAFTPITVLLNGQSEGIPSTLNDSSSWISQFQITYPVLNLNGDASSPVISQFNAYGQSAGSSGYPTLVILGPDQRILAIQIGISTATDIETPILSSIPGTPAYQIVDVQYLVDTEGLPTDFTISADNLLTAAFHTLTAGASPNAAIHQLNAFLGEVQRDEGNQLTLQQATQLSSATTPIIAQLQSS